MVARKSFSKRNFNLLFLVDKKQNINQCIWVILITLISHNQGYKSRKLKKKVLQHGEMKRT